MFCALAHEWYKRIIMVDLAFRENSILIFVVVSLMFTSTNNEWGFSFPIFSPPFLAICFLNLGHSDLGKIKSQNQLYLKSSLYAESIYLRKQWINIPNSDSTVPQADLMVLGTQKLSILSDHSLGPLGQVASTHLRLVALCLSLSCLTCFSHSLDVWVQALLKNQAGVSPGINFTPPGHVYSLGRR